MEALDELVIEGIADRLLSPARIELLLAGLLERNAAKDRAVDGRRAAIEGELANVRDRLSRLYRAIEDDIVTLDDDLKGRIEHLKQERDIAQASLERLTHQAATSAAITPQRISAFADLMRDKLRNGDTQARKAWIGSLITRIEVDDDRIRVIGETPVLAAAVTGQNPPSPGVRGFVRNWRARQDSNLLPQD